MSVMSVCELETQLKQFEATLPGQDVYVQVRYQSYEGGHLNDRTCLVRITDLKWSTRGPVLVTEAVS